jgi:membrane protein required for colicin V production
VVFGGILIGTVIIGAFFNMALHYILRHGGLSGTDKLLGAVFGFIRAIFIVTFIMLIAKNISISEKYTKQCELCKGFDPLIDWLSPHMHSIISKVDIATRDHTEWLPESHLDVETA